MRDNQLVGIAGNNTVLLWVSEGGCLNMFPQHLPKCSFDGEKR